VRDLDWDGCWNARDLGGLRTSRATFTRERELVRSDALDGLTANGWRAVSEHGIRTIIDLRNPDQRPSSPARVAGVRVIHVPLEDGLQSDARFAELMRSGTWATSMYLGAFLESWPERVVRVLEEIASAPPGGIVFHCKKGSDRTGVVALAILAIAEVDAEAIIDDYERTASRLRTHGDALGVLDDAAALATIYERLGATPRSGVLKALDVWRAFEPTVDTDLLRAFRPRIV
jgi:protein tyrosine/serine phosphatase